VLAAEGEATDAGLGRGDRAEQLLRVTTSQTRTTPAGLPAAIHLPSALYATLLQGTDHAVCPFRAPRRSSAASHTATTSSCPAVTRRRPSGLQATAARTLSEVARARSLPSLGCHSFNSPWVSSPFPVEARSRPSGEKARPVTSAAWPRPGPTASPCAAS